jgi:hypothetical protein
LDEEDDEEDDAEVDGDGPGALTRGRPLSWSKRAVSWAWKCRVLRCRLSLLMG